MSGKREARKRKGAHIGTGQFFFVLALKAVIRIIVLFQPFHPGDVTRGRFGRYFVWVRVSSVVVKTHNHVRHPRADYDSLWSVSYHKICMTLIQIMTSGESRVIRAIWHRSYLSYANPAQHTQQITNTTQLYIYIIKIKLHSSCEIEDFVETQVCKLSCVCDTPIARVTGCVSSLRI